MKPKLSNSGWGGIRTHEPLSRLPVFKTGAFNRSATHPDGGKFSLGQVFSPAWQNTGWKPAPPQTC